MCPWFKSAKHFKLKVQNFHVCKVNLAVREKKKTSVSIIHNVDSVLEKRKIKIILIYLINDQATQKRLEKPLIIRFSLGIKALTVENLFIKFRNILVT